MGHQTSSRICCSREGGRPWQRDPTPSSPTRHPPGLHRRPGPGTGSCRALCLCPALPQADGGLLQRARPRCHRCQRKWGGDALPKDPGEQLRAGASRVQLGQPLKQREEDNHLNTCNAESSATAAGVGENSLDCTARVTGSGGVVPLCAAI